MMHGRIDSHDRKNTTPLRGRGVHSHQELHSRTNYAEIRSTIIQRRITLGLTQLGLAEISGVSERTIQNFESGRHDTALSKALDLAEALGLEIHIRGPKTNRTK
jgi:DNA-binding XRE family transcriptional regulator